MTPRAAAGALGLLALIGVLDRVTGPELSFAVFYVLPVALATWDGGFRAGIAFSVLSAGVWHFNNAAAGVAFSNPAIPYWNSVTRLAFFLIITWLMARLREALDDATVLARTDTLTGALNGRAFRDLAALELERHRRHQRPFTLVYADLDNFKAVNDSGGHAAGDEVLRVVAGELARALRASDAMARLGGDEFALLFVETGAEDASLGVDRVRRRVVAAIQKRGWPVGLSMGVVTFVAAPPSVEDMLHLADQALYEAKRSGKDRATAVVFSGDPQAN